MKSYKTILFDLDGTLTDPAEGITNSVCYALNKYGIQVENKQSLYKFIGPPLQESFQVFYGFSVEKSMEAVDYYREYFKEKGIFQNMVYSGIPQLLSSLKTAGKCLLVASSKPEVFVRQILEHFSLSEYFTFIAGSELGGTRVKKAEVISYALKSAGIEDIDSALMVGDREHDVLGAAKLGMDCIGVLFGYGDRQELESAGAKFLAADVAELRDMLNN